LKIWAKNYFISVLVNCTLCESSMLYGNYFILVESISPCHASTEKLSFIWSTVFAWTHFCHRVCCTYVLS